jgi:putative intracellular protease/amidase
MIDYLETRRELERRGSEVIVASPAGVGTHPWPAQVVSDTGEVVNCDEALETVDPLVEDFERVVVIGNHGAMEYLMNDSITQHVLREFRDRGKVLGAIGEGPVVLGEAGILKNRKATAWFTEDDHHVETLLERQGAQPTHERVTVDGRIITSRGGGPNTAKLFAETLAAAG